MEHINYIKLIENQRDSWRNNALVEANEINKLRQQLTTKENDVNSLKGAIQACDHIIKIFNDSVNENDGSEDETVDNETVNKEASLREGGLEFDFNFMRDILKLRDEGREGMRTELEAELPKMKWNPSNNLFGDDIDPIMGEN